MCLETASLQKRNAFICRCKITFFLSYDKMRLEIHAYTCPASYKTEKRYGKDAQQADNPENYDKPRRTH